MTEVGRILLKDRAFDHIKALILDGSYQPGHFLSESDLCTALEMSKTPIRAALERLEEQGFVTIAPQRGVIVRELSPREIADHYDFRIALESWITRTMAGRLNAEQIADLEQNLIEQHAQTGGDVVDLRGFMRSDAQFHHIITAATGNAEFVWAMQRQWDKLQRLVESIAFKDPTVPPRSCAEHQAIFDALVAGDGELAARRAIEHLEHGKKFMLLGGVYGS